MPNGGRQCNSSDSRSEVSSALRTQGPALLSFGVGIDPVEFQEDARESEGPRPPDSNLHPGQTPEDRRNDNRLFQKRLRWHALLHPAVPAEELSTDAGSGSDDGTSDGEEVVETDLV
eukprot:261630-Pyramimonas_sp.AAC.1